jgi:hypothetical protein
MMNLHKLANPAASIVSSAFKAGNDALHVSGTAILTELKLGFQIADLNLKADNCAS